MLEFEQQSKTLAETWGYREYMKTNVTTAEAKTHFSRLLRQVEAGETIAISKHDETVAFLVPRARLEALVETTGVSGNPAAMKAIRSMRLENYSFIP